MLTGKIGNEIINCYDGTHTKDQLKKWCSKRIILCPVCNKPYEYCHGKVKIPYFRHIDKNECEDKYSESETEEHLIGKRDLFEWIRKRKGVTDAVLEGWIPETKQRPDIVFKYNNKKYVIEYQCTPIASEWDERHDLYKAANIHDIWICGTKKYLQKNMRDKYIQNHSVGFYDSEQKKFISIRHPEYGRMQKISTDYFNSKNYFNGFDLDTFTFNGTIYNKLYGETNIALNKRAIRSTRKNRKFKKTNYYLDLQTKKLIEKIKNSLNSLSNKNWKFYLTSYQTHDFTYYSIHVDPVIYGKRYFDDIDDVITRKCQKIKLYKMNYYDFKRYATDIESLKQLLLIIMENNKNTLLKYPFNNIRIMEVLHE